MSRGRARAFRELVRACASARADVFARLARPRSRPRAIASSRAVSTLRRVGDARGRGAATRARARRRVQRLDEARS